MLLASSLRMIWGLLIVLGIILIFYALFKKRFSLLRTAAGQRINIIEMKPIMPKKTLCIVEVDGREFLLAMSGEHIQIIADLDQKHKKTFEQSLQNARVESQS